MSFGLKRTIINQVKRNGKRLANCAIDSMCGRCDYCRLFIGRTKRFSYNDLAEGIVCARYTDLEALR